MEHLEESTESVHSVGDRCVWLEGSDECLQTSEICSVPSLDHLTKENDEGDERSEENCPGLSAIPEGGPGTHRGIYQFMYVENSPTGLLSTIAMHS